MIIRTATLRDLDAIACVEAACFPQTEAATKAEFEERLKAYADHFWLMLDGDYLIAFVDGMVTDEKDLRDEMYHRADLHREEGAWQMVFGVNTLPEYRRQGHAATLLRALIGQAREQHRKGLVLTCKDPLVHYYAALGFQDEGISALSTHGGVPWHQMRLVF